VSDAVNQNYNLITNNWIEAPTGMSGIWIQQTYYSKARDMARFGLLNLNKGAWSTDTVLKDAAYFNAMTNTSQNLNLAYGYLWWLNGKAGYKLPGMQLNYTGSLIPNAPNDMFAALGKNDQKIYVIPSQNMVVIRQGNSANAASFASSDFDNRLWDYIDQLTCSTVSIKEIKEDAVSVYPNPADEKIGIKSEVPVRSAVITHASGISKNVEVTNNEIDLRGFEPGIYFLSITFLNGKTTIVKVGVN